MYPIGYFKYLETGYLPISLLKEYVYCPRAAYLEFFTNITYLTESMKEGKNITIDYIQRLTKERHIQIQPLVKSKTLKLYGFADVIQKQRNYIIVYEIKRISDITKKSLYKHHKHFLIQLIAYTIAAEETFKKTAKEAYIIAKDKLIKVKMTPTLRKITYDYSKLLHQMITKEQEPTPRKTSKCNYCKMRKLCFF